MLLHLTKCAPIKYKLYRKISPYKSRMANKQDEVRMNICAETQGCFEMDPDTNEPQENCAYSKLILAGFHSDILCSEDERDANSINYLRNLVCPVHLAGGGPPVEKCIRNV